MKENICPLCGEQCSTQPNPNRSDDTIVACKLCGEFIINDSIMMSYDSKADLVRHKDNSSIWILNPTIVRLRCNLIYEFLLSKPFYKINDFNYRYRFFYETDTVGQTPSELYHVNVAGLMKNYPKNIGEKLDRILLNISRRYPNIGETFEFKLLPSAMLFMESPLCAVEKSSEIAKEQLPKIILPSDPNAKGLTLSFSERNTLLEYLCNIGFLQRFNLEGLNKVLYKFTAKAWERVGELTERHSEINQGFIAMRFPNDKDSEPVKQNLVLISDAFKEAINTCGYAPRLMLDIEHNNQIVPEIFFEIEQSKFTVVDVTHPNYGAYYEAGYAQALGKQVIICCRKGSEPPHFDISQKNMVFWKDKPDLIERLTKRIQATVGKNI